MHAKLVYKNVQYVNAEALYTYLPIYAMCSIYPTKVGT